MLEFLASLLILILSLNPSVSNDPDKTIVFEKLEENFPIISVTPTAFYQEELEQDEEPDSESQHENNENEDTYKVKAYNTESESVIINVSNQGVDHSPVLVPCSGNLCEPGAAEGEIVPPPEPTPIKDQPEFLGPPEVIPIEPPVIVPPDPPITPPHNPCRCSSNKDIVCLMIFPCAEAY